MLSRPSCSTVTAARLPESNDASTPDESVLVCWYDHDDGPVVRDTPRVRTEGDRVVSIRYHFFSPDVLADVCGELRVPWRSNGYRYWPLNK
jgi:hypothetical protein